MPEQLQSGFEATVRQVPSRVMISIRGDLSDKELASRLSGVLENELPEQCRLVRGNDLEVAWMAPDELLLMADEGRKELVELIGQALEGMHHLVVDVSAMRAEFEVSGPVRDILAKGTPTDVSMSSFKAGDFRRSRIGQIAAAFWLLDETRMRIICRCSEADYLAKWIASATASGSELGFHHPA